SLHNRQLEQDVATGLIGAGFEAILWNRPELENVPVSSVLHRMTCVVHSGSCPISGLAARFGVPQVVLPFLEDEAFWAERVSQLQIGKAIQERTLKTVVDAVKAVSAEDKIREQAKQLAGKIQSRNGLVEAADKIDEIALR